MYSFKTNSVANIRHSLSSTSVILKKQGKTIKEVEPENKT